MKVKIVGGGLAGCEAAYMLLKHGIDVDMYEMRPSVNTPAHHTEHLAELVCSNSLKSEALNSASGLLKAEIQLMGSLVLQCAQTARVPAGGALAVDRDSFSKEIERVLGSFDDFSLIREEVTDVDSSIPTIIATGPLTSPRMAECVGRLTGDDKLYFYDAAAPIVAADSIDYDKAFFGARYGKGGNDYLNVPMNKQEYLVFQEALLHAKRAVQEVGGAYFEGCKPVEIIAESGVGSLRFGPLRPVGLHNPTTGEKYYAVMQLRKENIGGDAYNLVGFQTSLLFGEQKRVFGLIPALKNAEFLRYGVMHRNTFLNSPKLLTSAFMLKSYNGVFIAGQLSGVEGYMESAMSGMLAGCNMLAYLKGKKAIVPPEETIMGALSRYVSNASNNDFQPMNSNFGILPPIDIRIKDKKERKQYYSERSIAAMQEYITEVQSIFDC